MRGDVVPTQRDIADAATSEYSRKQDPSEVENLQKLKIAVSTRSLAILESLIRETGLSFYMSYDRSWLDIWPLP